MTEGENQSPSDQISKNIFIINCEISIFFKKNPAIINACGKKNSVQFIIYIRCFYVEKTNTAVTVQHSYIQQAAPAEA